MERKFLNLNKFVSVLFFLGSLSMTYSQEILKQGKDIVNNNNLKYTRTNKEFGNVSFIKNMENVEDVLAIETTVRPQFIYKASTAIPIKKMALEKGQKVLVAFKGKTVFSGLETGEARFLWVLNQTGDYKGNISSTISLSKEWKQYYIPFEITQDVKKEKLRMAIQFGYQPQKALFSDIEILVFDKTVPLEKLPKTKIKYVGMEEDAAWRKKALANIESIRKGTFNLRFEKNGVPLKNKQIEIKQIKHEFSWGATINAADILNDKNQLKYLSRDFNEVVFANDLKIKSWHREKNRARTLAAMEAIGETDLKLKGHVLIWPGFQYQNKETRTMENNPEELTKLIRDHVVNITETTKGKVSHWDVVNEAYTNKDFQRITGSEEILYDGFRILKELQPTVGRFTNEYGIISKGGIDFEKQQWYYEYIKRIDKNTGGLVDGIGIQCHIGSDLTPPEKVISILNYYGTLKKKISISEFTMEIKDDEVREKYTADFIIAAFSQPNVSEFLFWGFHAEGNPKAILYHKDWTYSPMGKAYHDLVLDRWQTELKEKTNKEGQLSVNGFYGTYEYRYKEKGKIKKGVFVLKKNGAKELKIELK
ncbi:MAG: endo-1,4-beta-xylanase [Flavicella sp.]|nr:endo-1,4-beta-xylanase [Flavicella sp.]